MRARFWQSNFCRNHYLLQSDVAEVAFQCVRLAKYEWSAHLFPFKRAALSFSWCSSAKILLPGLVRSQQLHASSAITEPTHPFRRDYCEGRAPLVERGNSTCFHWNTASGLEEEKNTSLRIQHPTIVFKGERSLASSGRVRYTVDIAQ